MGFEDSNAPSLDLSLPDKIRGSPGDPNIPLLMTQACGGGADMGRKKPEVGI